jgi:hypothetical protein
VTVVRSIVACDFSSSEESAEVEVSGGDGVPVRVVVGVGDDVLEGVASDVWDALTTVRAQLETTGRRLCCNASRPNAFSSSMVRQLTGGFGCYIVERGRPVDPKAVVDVLAPADCCSVGSLEDQNLSIQEWMASCRRPLAVLRARMLRRFFAR